MTIYPIVLFLHKSGAIGYFLGIGTWLFVLVGPDGHSELSKCVSSSI